MNKKTKLQRVSEKMINDINKCSVNRVEKYKIDNKTRYFSELTHLMVNCPSWNNVLTELSSIPRKEDIDKFPIANQWSML